MLMNSIQTAVLVSEKLKRYRKNSNRKNKNWFPFGIDHIHKTEINEFLLKGIGIFNTKGAMTLFTFFKFVICFSYNI